MYQACSPPDLRRDAGTLWEYNNIAARPHLSNHNSYISHKRLKSRNAFWTRGAALADKIFDIEKNGGEDEMLAVFPIVTLWMILPLKLIAQICPEKSVQR